MKILEKSYQKKQQINGIVGDDKTDMFPEI